MNRRWVSNGMCAILLAVFLHGVPGEAATFSSGSTGSLGALAPVSNTTVILPVDGILNYTTVTIPSGVTVTFQRNTANTPVTLLAQGDISVSGTINVSGQDAVLSVGTTPAPGGLGGPGGFSGGMSGSWSAVNFNGTAGQGPGGGRASIRVPFYTTSDSANYGAPSDFVALLPLFGGSGGGGAAQQEIVFSNMYSGGGGGGAIVLSSTTQITVQSTGTIKANGGTGNVPNCDWRAAGAGSGGAIRVVAPKVTNLGTIQALGGPLGCLGGVSGGGSTGRIRMESFLTGVVNATTPAASFATAPGPVTTSSVPALINLPTLTITTIGGQAVPSTPGGSYTVADVTLPPGTTNPVTVIVTATNTTVPSTFTFLVLPPFAAAATPVTALSSGTFASSTVSANLTLPAGLISVLQVHGNYLLP